MFKLEAGYMLIIAGFELVLCGSDICVLFLCVTLHYGCLVYNTSFWRHLPWSGHAVLFLQLHGLVCSASVFSLLRTVLLWLVMIWWVSFIQL